MNARHARLDTDFLIIGSGFGGSVSAMRLAEKGYRVRVVEQGKRFSQEDFAKTTWDLRRYLFMPRLGCHGIMQMSLLRDVFALHGAGVGGGSLVYANTLYVPPEKVFQDPAWVGLDWKNLLAPHYATALRMLGATTAPKAYLTDLILKEVAEELGQGHTFRPTEVGIFFGTPDVTVPDPYFGGQGPARTGCSHCGACMVGCRTGAKNTLDKNYLYFAEKLGVEVFPRQKAKALSPLPDGGYAVTLRSLVDGSEQRMTAHNVVVAAGVIGTLDLLLRMQAKGNLTLSPRLGHHVRTNSETLVGARSLRKDFDGSKGIAIAASVAIDANTTVEICRYNAGSDALASLATVMTEAGKPFPRWARWLGNVLRHPVQAVHCLIPFGWAKRTAILLVMQPIDNFMRMYLRRRWYSPWKKSLDTDRGTRKPVPVYFPLANEVARRMARKMGGIPQSGLVEILKNVPTTAHILGGCPMGTSSENGVVDVNLRVFGHPGLYIVDGSIIPSNLGVNPALTITALAEHAMSQIPAAAELPGK